MKKPTVLQIAFISLALNLAYCVYNGFLSVTSRSWWFLTLAAYYAVLSLMRFAVLIMRNRNQGIRTAQFTGKFTGAMLLVLSVVIAGTVYLSVISDTGTNYGTIPMITIATYSFTKVTLAVINYVRSQKNASPIIKALRNISFADAFVSIYSMQKSMLVTFEGMGEKEIMILNIFTGASIYILTVCLGLNLIVVKRKT